ncbi:aldo/keto reductase [Paraphaeosphaeria sporulosa]
MTKKHQHFATRKELHLDEYNASPTIAGKEVGPIGLGLIGFTWRANPIPTDEAIKVLKAALDNGMQPDGSPEAVCKSLDAAVAQLNGRQKIDLFEPEEYVQSGKIGGIGLYEVKASSIQAGSKITKIESVEVELSLFSLHVLKNGVAAATAELGIPLVAYSPLSRGFLSGQFRSLDDIPKESLLHHFPRFHPDVFPLNLQLADQIAEVAKKKGVTFAQLAINWVAAQAKKAGLPAIIPISGSTTVARVENSKLVEVINADLAEIEEKLKKLPTSYGGLDDREW